MKWRDLARELDLAVESLGEPQREHLRKLGVPDEILEMKPALIGVTRIRLSDPYEPHDRGTPAFVTPCLIDSPVTPESAEPDYIVRRGNLVDLVAWRPCGGWATRRGAAAWLGATGPQYLDPDPVRIWRHPLNWFRAGCTGLMLLATEPAERWRILVDCAGGLVGEDDFHAAELRQILQRPWAVPKVLIAPYEAHRAVV